MIRLISLLDGSVGLLDQSACQADQWVARNDLSALDGPVH